jgi:UDP-2,3-diacylglucosamine pyrophosphatase LpxH
MHHTVVISDIHLCEVEPTHGLWMRYRQAPFTPDTEVASMLDELRARVRSSATEEQRDTLELILNGDIFDFDAPRVIKGESVFHDLPRDAVNGVLMMKAILADHPVFVSALARVLLDGHRVVFIAGNHDVHVTFPEVRAVFTAAIVEAAVAQAEGATVDRDDIEARFVYRSWFHRTEDGIHIEHGNQYDSYNCFRYPMAPFGREPGEIQPTMGSLCGRHLTSRLGYFNPHVDDSYMLSFFGYFAHWARFYLFSTRSLIFAFLIGALRVFVELVRRRDSGSRARLRENVMAAARETGASFIDVARQVRLFARPAEDRLMVVAREFWVDRFSLGALTFLFALGWFVGSHGAFAVGAAVVPALLITYEISIPKPGLAETWRRVQALASRVARVQKARAVVFGHTHRPIGEWRDGVFLGNSGSWSPAFYDLECTKPISATRPVVWLKSHDGTLTGGLFGYSSGQFVEWEERKHGRLNLRAGRAA